MTRDEFDAFCGVLQASTNVIQWGNASVWKVGGKIFAVCSAWGPGEQQKISFKCSDLSYSMLCEQDGIAPAPYLARAKWVQLGDEDAMDDEGIKIYIGQAHKIVAGKLTEAQKKDLGLSDQKA